MASAGHITLLNQWIRNVPMREVFNDTFARFKSDRLAGRQHQATATVARLVQVANKVSEARDRTTLLRVVNG